MSADLVEGERLGQVLVAVLCGGCEGDTSDLSFRLWDMLRQLLQMSAIQTFAHCGVFQFRALLL